MKNILFLLCTTLILGACGGKKSEYNIPDLPTTSNLFGANALQALDLAIEQNPNSPENYYKASRILFFQKKSDKALQYLSKALSLDSQNEKYLFLEIKILLQLKKYAQALSKWHTFERNNNLNYNGLMLAGEVYWNNQQYKKANDFFKKAALITEKQASVYLWMQKTAFAIKDTLQVKLNFDKATKLQNSLYEAYYWQTSFMNTLQQPEQALAYAQTGLALNPKYDSLWQEQGIAYQLLTKNDSAILSYKKAYILNPNMYRASFELGVKALKENDNDRAKAYLENVDKNGVIYPKLYFYLGLCYQNDRKDEKAIAYFKKAIKNDEKDATAFQILQAFQEKIAQEKFFRNQDSLLKVQRQMQEKEQELYQKKLLEQQKAVQNP